MIGNDVRAIKAFLDTGCDTGISLTQDQVIKLGLRLPRSMNASPNAVALADNTLVPSYDYLIKLRFKDEEVDTTLSVIYTSDEIDLTEQISDEEASVVLLGREVMDEYLVKFDGIVRAMMGMTLS